LAAVSCVQFKFLRSLAVSMEEPSVSTRVLVILLWSMLHRCYGVHAGIQSSNIVVMPAPVVSSQYFNVLEIAEEMARRGNEVKILSTKYLKKRKSPVQHIEYELHGNADFIDDINKLSSAKKTSNLFGYFSIGKNAMELSYTSCIDILENNVTRNAIKEADMIVTLSLMICGIYVADIYDKPFIVLHPGPLPAIGTYAQVPLPPSYVPLAGSISSDKMNFLERTRTFIFSNVKNVVMDFIFTSYFRSLQEKFSRKSLESFSYLFSKAEAYIVTVDFAFEFVHPIMPNVFVTGPVTTKPANKLSTELENFMESSGEHGVVVISFGSAIMHLNHEVIRNIIQAVSRLKQKVIWKIKLDAEVEIPENLKVVDWLPQNDLLGHAKTRGFVSHMGINGATEAAYHGVPLVAACIMSDSYGNTVKFTEKAKMAKPIDVYSASADTWLEVIEDVIYNSSYKENAMKASKLMRSWNRTSVQRAGDVIQYAVENGGHLPHLKSYANNLYWFQYHCLDVVLFLSTIGCFAFYVFCKVAKSLFACICSWKRREKID